MRSNLNFTPGKMKHILFFAFTFVAMLRLEAQSPKYKVVSLPVEKNGVKVREPWTGGMDSPQFSGCDLNNDGIKDLFVFDRVGNKVITYLSNADGTDTMFSYAPQYEEVFPQSLSNWALIRDYNHDGLPDIFTYTTSASGPGIRVFKGSILNGNLHFDLVCPLIQYLDTPFHPYVFANTADIPAITDVNGDGDLDVLTYNQFGSTIGYFENQAAENPGNSHYDLDSFKYVMVTSCWGNITQNFSSNSITLNVSCKGGENGGSERHSGNSLYDIVDPVYNDIDLLNGNIGYNNVLLLRNCGGRINANVCSWDSIYPTCDVPMLIPSYPAAYGIDVNHDGLNDVLLSPNVTTAGRNVKNVTYYKNTGDTSCWYNYQNDSFIVHHMLDFGSDSKALFYDYDGDGLKDIIVGNYGYFRPFIAYLSTIAFYRNTGTATQPQFTEVTTDVDNLSAQNLVAFNPAFGDMDGDGHNDLIAGDLYGYLYFFKNAATNGSSFPVMTTSQYFGINIGLYAAPFIYDVNGDSLNDLIVGRQDGKLSYYWNFGTKTSPLFSPDSVNSNFGNINVTLSGFNYGYSQPYLMDSAGQLKLFVGSLRGSVFEYIVDPAKLRGGSFTLIDSNFLQHSVGTKATISIADINNDGKLEYLAGNSRGGLMLYSDSLWDPSTLLGIENIAVPKGELLIYPNPARDYFVCALQDNEFENPKTEVFNIVGEKMRVEINLSENKILIAANDLPSGFYVVKVSDKQKIYTGKILIER
ncbi:MAG: hypothetical protein JWO06_2021 [Bacteroidota bacterium]|nr:hypothetical protein [Bacteroidota bacterium]